MKDESDSYFRLQTSSFLPRRFIFCGTFRRIHPGYPDFAAWPLASTVCQAVRTFLIPIARDAAAAATAIIFIIPHLEEPRSREVREEKRDEEGR